ncbi:hydroxyisourate hydrolase [Williamsia sterculiae]|uniref:5-hydroxyisourate hydrolase n=1 Tax=Williamsia sterculiae TaxID=1344003 RepID=A0A1N7DYZ1_9NOCA|nr:hydroxyisourate hydrolase [Williamsia sterculiae]SIR81087.1 5-hydroxyisourate hydrolase [Williamsia sterculiae]
MSGLSTHVLDAVRGAPVVGLTVTLQPSDGAAPVAVDTDDDGRIPDFGVTMTPGDHRLTFDTGEWFSANGIDGFYPEVVIVFTVRDPARHHHVPLLLSPYAYSTYRGS